MPNFAPPLAQAIGMLLGVLTLAASPARAEPVPTVGLTRSTAAASFELDGVLEARTQSVVAAQTGGSLLAVAVRAGDRVRRGQVLARIDARQTEAAVQAAQAGVAQAQALQREALDAVERTRELHRTGYVSVAARDQAEARWRAADAALDAARAARTQATLARAYTEIAAPFDGVVRATHAEPGELAQPGTPLLTLYAPDALRAVVQVPSSRAPWARAATRTEVRLPDGRWVAPLARTELPAADPVTQTAEWRLGLEPRQTSGLAPGVAVRVRFRGDETSAATPAARTVVPASAVLRRGELTAVYVALDGRFALRAVRLGPAAGLEQVELLSGVREGERIAVDAVRAGLAGAVPAAR